MIQSVPARRQHARELATHLSEESKRSINLFGPREPMAVIRESMKVSRESHAVSADGELIFIWGVRELEPDIALGWFMTTTAVRRHGHAFWEATREIVQALHAHYPLVTNVIHPDNVLTIRWAEEMGFTVHPVETRMGVRLHRAEIVRPEHV